MTNFRCFLPDAMVYPRSRERSIELGMWTWRILWPGRNVECRMIMTWYMMGRQKKQMKKNHQAKREHYNKEFYSTFIRHPSTLFKKRAIKHYHLPLRFLFFFFWLCSFLPLKIYELSFATYLHSQLMLYNHCNQQHLCGGREEHYHVLFLSFVLAVHLLALETKNSFYFFLFYCSQLTFTTVLHYSFISIEVRIIIYGGDMVAIQQQQTDLDCSSNITKKKKPVDVLTIKSTWSF